MNTNTFNPYVITWAVLTPVKGKVTKKDLKRMNVVNTFGLIGNEVIGHFSNIDRAKAFVNDIVGLSKNYEVVFITDKQFALVNVKDGVRMVATKKQLQERYFI